MRKGLDRESQLSGEAVGGRSDRRSINGRWLMDMTLDIYLDLKYEASELDVTNLGSFVTITGKTGDSH